MVNGDGAQLKTLKYWYAIFILLPANEVNEVILKEA